MTSKATILWVQEFRPEGKPPFLLWRVRIDGTKHYANMVTSLEKGSLGKLRQVLSIWHSEEELGSEFKLDLELYKWFAVRVSLSYADPKVTNDRYRVEMMYAPTKGPREG